MAIVRTKNWPSAQLTMIGRTLTSIHDKVTLKSLQLAKLEMTVKTALSIVPEESVKSLPCQQIDGSSVHKILYRELEQQTLGAIQLENPHQIDNMKVMVPYQRSNCSKQSDSNQLKIPTCLHQYLALNSPAQQLQ
jgi:hypothetical protein